MRPKERRTQAGGRSIRFFEAGHGPPLVLVHGIGASSDWWLPNYPVLAAQFTTYALDLPGSGESTAPTDAEIQSPGIVMREFLDLLGIERSGFVGHSMGGYVAGTFAASHPERVSALVLLDSAGFGSLRHPLLRMMTVPRLGELLMRSPEFGVDFFINTVVLKANRKKVPGWLRAETKRHFHRPDFGHEFLRNLRTGISPTGRWIKGPLLTELLAPSRVPILVIWGRDDPVFSSDQALDMRDSLPRADVQITADTAGHVPQLTQADFVFDRVVPFLAAHLATAGAG